MARNKCSPQIHYNRFIVHKNKEITTSQVLVYNLTKKKEVALQLKAWISDSLQLNLN